MRTRWDALILLAALLAGRESSNAIVGSGTSKSEKRDVPAFEAITANGGYKIDVTVGEATEVTVEGDDNLLPLIRTSVEQNALVITSKEPYHSKSGIKVTIKTPQLSGVTVNGSGDVAMHGVRGESLKLAINGSGSMTATGSVQEVDGAISGSGDLKLADLVSQKAKVQISGSGSGALDAAQTLDVHISGSGDVRFKEHPGLSVNKSITGSGSVKPM